MVLIHKITVDLEVESLPFILRMNFEKYRQFNVKYETLSLFCGRLKKCKARAIHNNEAVRGPSRS